MEQVSAVIYNGKKIIPAPLVTINRNVHRSEDGGSVGETIELTLNGKLVSCRGGLWSGHGYPPDSGNCCKFDDILNKQEELREFFDIGNTTDYKWLEIQSYEGGVAHPPKKWRVRVKDLNFKEGLWVQVCDYTLQLECLNDSDEECDVQHNDRWEIKFEPDNGCAYHVVRSLSCKAKDFVQDDGEITDGSVQAKKWIDKKLADQPADIGSEVGLVGYTAYNHITNWDIDHTGGVYTVTQDWTLSQSKVFSTVVVESTMSRDGDCSVKVHGSFKSQEADCDAAWDAFDKWDKAGEPYNLAKARNANVLSCPASRSITRTTQVDSAGKSLCCSEHNRVVEFSYEFTTGVASSYDMEVTVAKKINNIAECGTNITVSGTIQGHGCDTTCNIQTRFQRALDAFTAFNPASYSEGYPLINSQVSRNERKGNISFTYEYDSKFQGGYKLEETQTEGWDCNDRGSDGTPADILTVDGVVTGLCTTSIETLAAAANARQPECDGGYITKKSITTDAINHKVTYHYTCMNDDPDGARVEIDKTIKNGPDKCDITFTTVQIQIIGNGCSNEKATTNAQNALSKINVSSLATGRIISSVVVINNHGKVNATYEFSSAGDTEINITRTETWDSDCILKTQIQGHIKGYCSAGGMAAAEAAYANINLNTLCTGYIVSRSVSRNPLESTISFSLECQNRPHNYIEERNITTKHDVDSAFDIKMIEGSITPFCNPNTGKDGLVAAGKAAWETIEATLDELAGENCTRRRTSVTISEMNGKVQYSYEYMCPKCQYFTGSLEESIETFCNRGGHSVAVVPILGRQCGPLIQDKNTRAATTFGVTITVRFPACSAKPSGLASQIQSIISSVDCDCGAGCSGVNAYIQSDQETWNPISGRYTRSITKILECC